MFEDLLARIGRIFTEHDIPYMIIGGQAVLLYGEPRLTKDIDVTLGVGTDRFSEVLDLLEALILVPATEDVENFVQRTMVLPALDPSTGIRVDLIFSNTPYEREAITRSRKVTVGQEAVAFASAEDLIIHKIFAGRPRDMEDVRSVMLRNSSLEVEYIRRWLREFDAGGQGGGFLDAFENVLKSDSDPGSG